MSHANHRPTCRRCKGSGMLWSKVHVDSGRCWTCKGKGCLPSLNDRIETKRAELADLLDLGQRLAAKKAAAASPNYSGFGWRPANERNLAATRDAYRRERATLRSLEAELGAAAGGDS